MLEGTKLRHYIEAGDSTWYAEFTHTKQVTYSIGRRAFTSTPEVFVERHYHAVRVDLGDQWSPIETPNLFTPQVNVSAECEILHEGVYSKYR